MFQSDFTLNKISKHCKYNVKLRVQEENMQNQNIFKSAAEILYKDDEKRKKEKELRNSLINELGDELEPKHILYASNEELIKMKDERKLLISILLIQFS